MLISGDTYERVRGLPFEFVAVPPTRVKGESEPLHLHGVKPGPNAP